MVTWTTCDFDSCGTGFQGYEWVSKDKFEEISNSEKIFEWLDRQCRNDIAIDVFKELLSRKN